MTDRQFAIHYARVMLAEAARRRHSHVNRNYYWTLMASAQASRREAFLANEPNQHELFA